MRVRRIVTSLLGSALLAASAGAQEAPHLLADIDRAPHVPFSTQLREEPADFFTLGSRLLFSTASFPSFQRKLTWVREEMLGNWYRTDEPAMEGWLCPALFQYFPEAPKQMFVQTKSRALSQKR